MNLIDFFSILAVIATLLPSSPLHYRVTLYGGYYVCDKISVFTGFPTTRQAEAGDTVGRPSCHAAASAAQISTYTARLVYRTDSFKDL